MIGELKSSNVRTVHQKKVLRIELDIPWGQVRSEVIDEEALVEWLANRVSREIGIELVALDKEGQRVLD